jgi:hypothetical protein
MEVESLKDYLVAHRPELLAAIEKGNYCPNPVRRVEIPKDNGSKRQLGIPTLVDRVIKQAKTTLFSSYSIGKKSFYFSLYAFCCCFFPVDFVCGNSFPAFSFFVHNRKQRKPQ